MMGICSPAPAIYIATPPRLACCGSDICFTIFVGFELGIWDSLRFLRRHNETGNWIHWDGPETVVLTYIHK